MSAVDLEALPCPCSIAPPGETLRESIDRRWRHVTVHVFRLKARFWFWDMLRAKEATRG